jgi:hypothetical protein
VKTMTVEAAERGRSPLGSHIRFLLDGPHGNLIHTTVPPGMVGRLHLPDHPGVLVRPVGGR